jgi:hypothetical protein
MIVGKPVADDGTMQFSIDLLKVLYKITYIFTHNFKHKKFLSLSFRLVSLVVPWRRLKSIKLPMLTVVSSLGKHTELNALTIYVSFNVRVKLSMFLIN